MNRSIDNNAKAFAGLRIAVGALFLIFGHYKVFGTQFTLGGGLQSWINRFLEDGAYPRLSASEQESVTRPAHRCTRAAKGITNQGHSSPQRQHPIRCSAGKNIVLWQRLEQAGV
jgi:hypothetical protein